MSKSLPLVPALDGLRAVAALIVLVSHYSNATGFLGGSIGHGGGQFGVMLFFALSGFLMCYVTEGQPALWRNVLRFWQRRFARVVPLYVFVVLVAYFAATHSFAGKGLFVYEINDGNVLRHLFLLDAVSILWTIPVEISFYVLFPLIWFVRRKLNSDALMAVLLLTVFAGWEFFRRKLGHPSEMPVAFLGILVRGHVFLLGVIAYLAFRPMGKTPLNGVWLAIVLLMPFCLPGVSQFITGTAPTSSVPWSDPLCFVIALLAVLASARAGWARQALGNGVMRYLGRISYSVYLLHLFVLIYMERFYHLTSNPVDLAILLLLVIALASGSYFIVEKPSRTYLNRWAMWGKRKAPSKAAAE